MTVRYGIDTSILVRLATGDPPDDFARCVQKLSNLVEDDGADVLASNQVIGESYVALQHHYGYFGPQILAATCQNHGITVNTNPMVARGAF